VSAGAAARCAFGCGTPSRSAVHARESTDEGLEQDSNSLDAQREACEAYVASQRAEGWVLVRDRHDDGR
jgi:DNA invertase Pin-like site-specific DNA recombinase